MMTALGETRTEQLGRFGVTARILHWLMAILIVAMIFIGGALVGSLGHYDVLLEVHKSLGFAILALAVLRIGNRLWHRPPPPPLGLSKPERLIATGSEILMYALFLAQPLIGWALVSASGIPIRIFGGLRVPAIVPTDAGLYATLRTAHGILAYLLLAAFTAHICAVLFHALLLRDKLIQRMTFGSRR